MWYSLGKCHSITKQQQMQQVWLCREWPASSFSAHYLLSHSISPLLSQRPCYTFLSDLPHCSECSWQKMSVWCLSLSLAAWRWNVLCKQEPLLLQFQTIGAKQRLTSLKPFFFFRLPVLLSGFFWLKWCFSSFVTGPVCNVYIALPISALYCFCHSVSDSIHFHFIALLLLFNLWPLLKMNHLFAECQEKGLNHRSLASVKCFAIHCSCIGKVVMENYKMPEIRSLFWRTLTCL